MYESRTYRQKMGSSRFNSLSLSIGESDLWIGYQPSLVDTDSMVHEAARYVRKLRNEILDYPDKTFLSRYTPLENSEPTTALIEAMLKASCCSKTGPMASVAGAIAQALGIYLKEKFLLTEIVIENGGDLYIDVLQELSVKLIAPGNPLSGKLSLVVDVLHSPLGICTSSGKIGHSHSFGKADAVMVACHEASLADAYATAFCNRVQTKLDVQRICNEMNTHADIISAVVLLDDKLALCGELEVRT
ncbi:UPF0280 family protein [uncultured Sphaerochaeta sp.]|uniref:UPF0280 family protein n=1 Tax=uncultured Sphaerochaeta sp. TaxID=886478 RepID=UPI002A0A1092|nr:UPF0280 family protein [uncultured Sphaerochaeta sp.]